MNVFVVIPAFAPSLHSAHACAYIVVCVSERERDKKNRETVTLSLTLTLVVYDKFIQSSCLED